MIKSSHYNNNISNGSSLIVRVRYVYVHQKILVRFARGIFFTMLEKCTLFRTIHNIIATIDRQEKPEEEKIYTLNGRYYIQTINDIFFFPKSRTDYDYKTTT